MANVKTDSRPGHNRFEFQALDDQLESAAIAQ
jgi:hypothetical protein